MHQGNTTMENTQLTQMESQALLKVGESSNAPTTQGTEVRGANGIHKIEMSEAPTKAKDESISNGVNGNADFVEWKYPKISNIINLYLQSCSDIDNNS